ncbi:MAG: 30S ribosomal protein S3 [Clostridia bacterium]|nr:30S ribosomal protein S3 [Clostridia bacterium]
MGQKVSPHGLRVGVIKDWDSTWYADKKEFANLLVEDNAVREYIQKKYRDASVSRVTIERTQGTNGKIVVNILTARPGVIIGTKGAGIEALKKALDKIVEGKQLVINIKEIKQPDLDSAVVAQSIAAQIEKRVLVKRAMKSTLQRVMKSGAQGCKIVVSGRINGAEIARSETYSQGSIPLHTLRANIDYGLAEAHTTYGVLGVKVWIYKGEVLNKQQNTTSKKQGGDE